VEHPKEADRGIKSVVPVREAALNFLPEAVLKRDALGISPRQERCRELSPVPPVALAAERLLGEPGVALLTKRLASIAWSVGFLGSGL
jgi:hypothetical protein